MDAFLVYINSTLSSVVHTRAEVRELLQEDFERICAQYNATSSSDWIRNTYRSDIAYASSCFNAAVYEVDLDNLKRLPNNWMYGSIQHEGIERVTETFYTVQNTTYAGNLKLFATVTKRGIKSTGREVIVDPQLSGTQLRPISEYEELIGTFARVKATLEVNSAWSPVLFFSPESLGNYRVETQQLSGRVVVFSGE